MKAVPSLRRELIVALAAVLLAALGLAAVAVLFLLPVGEPLQTIVLFLAAVVAADLLAFLLLGFLLFRQVVLKPVRSLLRGTDALLREDYSRRVPLTGSVELQRLAAAVNELADRLVLNQERLTDNIQSLNEVNRALTEARDELVRAEKLASAGQLAAGIAHEIGNPLGAILGYLEVAERRPNMGPELVGDIRREARRIDRIVRSLLDYARPRQPAPRAIDVNDVVGGALELVEAQGHFKEIELIRELGEGLPMVHADAHQLEQIMVNLVLNAAQACQADGNGRPHYIKVATEKIPYATSIPPSRRRDDPPGIDYSHLRRLQARREGLTPLPLSPGTEVVRISVIDNGPGIPQEIMDRVFDPFFSTKETGHGTGLGLAVSARLIDGMGGTIQVDSAEGRGSHFSVVLPAVRLQLSTIDSEVG